MNFLTRRSPSKESGWNIGAELQQMRRQLDRFFSEGPSPWDAKSENLSFSEWRPSVDITEDDNEYLIRAELPEVKKEDISIEVENGALSVSGERKFEKEDKQKRYHRVERAYGQFQRMFALPEDSNPDNIEAEYQNGVLKIHLPKDPARKAGAKRIDVT